MVRYGRVNRLNAPPGIFAGDQAFLSNVGTGADLVLVGLGVIFLWLVYDQRNRRK